MATTLSSERSNRPDRDTLQNQPRRPGRYLRTASGALLVGGGVFLLYLLFTKGSAVLVGLVLTVGTAALTGVILERIDSSRQADHEGHPDDYWGFRGRPGS
jgi:hypothetical protein